MPHAADRRASVSSLSTKEMSDDQSHNGYRAAIVALNTHDILCHVFEVASRISNRSKLSSEDLLRSALVSRAFCKPALRVLWRNMSPPTPLWQLLVSSNKESSQRTPTSEFFDAILSNKPYTDPAQWARFMWYARFVQELDITDFGMVDKHKQLIDALVAQNSGKSIFPSLQTLWWSSSSYSDSSYFPLFIPELRSAIFHFPHSAEADIQLPQSHTFLSQLRASSPRLGYLCVDASWERIGMNHFGVISSFEHLTDLTLVFSISLTAFCELAAMPRMNSLRIVHVRSDEGEPLPPHTRIHAPHLTLISVGGNCPSLTRLFTALDAPGLASMSFHAMCDDWRAERHPDYVSCITALTTVCPPATMEDLCIALDENGGPQMLEYMTDLINPLLVFRNLTHFSFSCPMVKLVADNYDFSEITYAWPKLQTFKLWQAYWDPCIDSDDEDSTGIPIPTPDVLECFRDHCPDLRELVLPHLDFDADVPVRSLAGSHHGLKLLAFGQEDLEGDEDEEDWLREPAEPDGDRVATWARYVSDLFPNLNATKSLEECRSLSTATGWTEVFKRVHDLRKARKGSSSGGAVSKLRKH